ncbi:Lrp/AsnC family leucine-responsive transcriptional regulator [Pedobacter cryoconitis]|uniref:Lrp/AsnC family leucine-responsive transcriptional regulator n=1 Tax=Pedobacter cryoconitis TaxID=188932 RepID=A0A7W9DY28_9SPHI|nr:Lrp/AsnC family transcriptional regulator [Pedobacter cryoconitis]MBB5634794.1 Lrp/AsnC family leucine-responsive transcriptional regulator [Pedobacter cryoconitis]MBB6272074.1 Lrp/AsnC family leucine-responsive transcriptional regulator [Pedobacter cryoconitis]
MDTFDPIDKKILKVLQADARLNTKQIAGKIGLTVTPTYERLKKIEQSGVIKEYVALLDRDKIGKTIVAFINVSLQLHSKPLINAFEKAIIKVPEVMECFHVAGNFDYLLKVVVKDMNSYQNFLSNKLATIENIAHVQSSFVMTEIKHQTAYVLD